MFSYSVHSNSWIDSTPYCYLVMLHLFIQKVIFISLDRPSNSLHLYKNNMHLYNQRICIMLCINRNYWTVISKTKSFGNLNLNLFVLLCFYLIFSKFVGSLRLSKNVSSCISSFQISFLEKFCLLSRCYINMTSILSISSYFSSSNIFYSYFIKIYILF